MKDGSSSMRWKDRTEVWRLVSQTEAKLRQHIKWFIARGPARGYFIRTSPIARTVDGQNYAVNLFYLPDSHFAKELYA